MTEQRPAVSRLTVSHLAPVPAKNIHEFIHAKGWSINARNTRNPTSYPFGQVQLVAVDRRRKGSATIMWASQDGDALALEQIPFDAESGRLHGVDRTGQYVVTVILLEDQNGRRFIAGDAQSVHGARNPALADPDLVGVWEAEAGGGSGADEDVIDRRNRVRARRRHSEEQMPA